MLIKKLPGLRNYKTGDGKSKSPRLEAWECLKNISVFDHSYPDDNPGSKPVIVLTNRIPGTSRHVKPDCLFV